MNFENNYNDKQKKDNGVFYTPEDIALFMSIKGKSFDDGGIWLDPCCGLGILSITLASLQENPIDFVKNRLIINDKDEFQLAIALQNFQEKFGVTPKSFNKDFLEADFECDYVIMNPPYFKYGNSDIYAYFLEKCSKISKGIVSINPISFTNGSKFKSCRESLLNFKSLNLYHFDNIPGHIFDDAKVRVSIIVAHNRSSERKTTSQIRWQTPKRAEMIQNLDNYLDDAIFNEDIFYKTLANTSGLIHPNSLAKHVVRQSDYPLWITSTPRYFITASSKKLDRTGQIQIFMKDEASYKRALILLNSSYLYWWWRTADSSMSLTKVTLLSLPWLEFNTDDNLYNELLESEGANKVYKMNAGRSQENVKHPKNLIKKLNKLLGLEHLIKLHD